MKDFESKGKFIKYLEKISGGCETEIVGSAFSKPLKNFSDIDVNVYGKVMKPLYEIITFNGKITLLSVYFYKSKKNIPKSMKYSGAEKVKRECQLAVDFLFKYLRTKNKKYLEAVQRRIK